MKTFKFSLVAALFAALFSAVGAQAHGLWIEPSKGGVNIYYGEAAHALREKKEKLAEFGAVEAWDAQGKAVAVSLKDDHFFAPGRGNFTATVLNGAGWGEGAEATKPRWFLRYASTWTKAIAPSTDFPMDIVPVGGAKPVFTVLKDGKPNGGAWIEVTAPNGWSKWFEADSTGRLEIKTPWPGVYILSTDNTIDESVTHNGKAYAKVYRAFALSVYKP